MSTETLHSTDTKIDNDSYLSVCKNVAASSAYFTPEEIEKAYKGREQHLINECVRQDTFRKWGNRATGVAIASVPTGLTNTFYAAKKDHADIFDAVLFTTAILSSATAITLYKAFNKFHDRVKYAVDRSQTSTTHTPAP